MKHLIVYAHPNPKSFNHAIMKAFAEELEDLDQDVRVRDLYALGFDPVIRQGDYELFTRGEVPEDIRVEQGHIVWADVITFISPIFWAGLPSLLKGYIERVYSHGFAYRISGSEIKGLLPGKKVVIINTTGVSLEQYGIPGMVESITRTIDHGIFKFCSMDVVAHKFFMGVSSKTGPQRKRMLDEVRALARNLVSSKGRSID